MQNTQIQRGQNVQFLNVKPVTVNIFILVRHPDDGRRSGRNMSVDILRKAVNGIFLVGAFLITSCR